MFPDKKSGYGGFDDLINTYMGGDTSFYTRGMNDGDLDYAMDVLSGYLKEEKAKVILDERSVRLKKGGECPVCANEIRQEFSRNGGKDYLNKCNKCGLTEGASEMGKRHQLSLEEFEWAYQKDDSNESVEKRAKEEQLVIALYRKIWSGFELTETEDAKLDAVLLSQKEAMPV